MAAGGFKLADRSLEELMATIKLTDKLKEEHIASSRSKMDNKFLECNSKHVDKTLNDHITNDSYKFFIDNSVEKQMASASTTLTNKSSKESLAIASSKHVDKCTEDLGATKEKLDDEAVGESLSSDSSMMPSLPSGIYNDKITEKKLYWMTTTKTIPVLILLVHFLFKIEIVDYFSCFIY